MNVIHLLNRLGIKNEGTVGSKGFIRIQCPFSVHEDKTPSAGINKDTLICHCFSCKNTAHISAIMRNKFGFSNEDIDEMLGNNQTTTFQNLNVAPVKQEVKKEIKKNTYNLNLIDFDPKRYNYTYMRGFTFDFLNYFNIKQCISSLYMDYMIIPIIDTLKGIDTFEARKLCYYEYFAALNKNGELNKLNGTYLKNGNVYDQSGDIIYNSKLKYLLQPKTLYASGSNLKETIFNIDRLDYNEDLYLSEGIATLGKLFQISKNISCLFGSALSIDQVKYLQKFKRVLLIPDNDLACLLLIEKLIANHMNNVFVCDIESEDTNESFIQDVKNSPKLSLGEYYIKLSKYLKPQAFEFKKISV